MNLLPTPATKPVEKSGRMVRLAGLEAPALPEDDYLLGLAADGLPVFARIARGPNLLAASDDPARLDNLLAAILQTVNVTDACPVVLATRQPRRWANSRARIIPPAGIGEVVREHLQSGARHRLVLLFEGLGEGWEIDPSSLAILTRSARLHLVAAATASYARRCRSLFSKILIGDVHNFSTLFDLTAPTTLTTPPAQGQFAYRHQSRWLYFYPHIP